MLGEDGALGRFAHGVAGPADALQAPAHRARRLDLDHEVDGAHVDAELEAAGGHEAAQLAPLQLVLDDDALLARQRPVVGADQLAAAFGHHAFVLGQLVQAGGQALGQAPGVAEDDGGAVGEHELEDAGVDARPDAAPGGTAGGRPAGRLLDDLAEVAHVLDRHHDLDVERLAHAGVDDGDRPGPPGRLEAAEEAGHLLQGRWVADSPMRCGGRSQMASSRSRLRARWAPRLVGASAWISSTMTASTPRSVSRALDVNIR